MVLVRLGLEAVLSNQHEHSMVLASQDFTLRALYTSMEVTMRRAAREQRQGRSMAFDEMRAMGAPTSTITFPRAEVVSRALGARDSSSNCKPRRVGEDEESVSCAIEIRVLRQCFSSF